MTRRLASAKVQWKMRTSESLRSSIEAAAKRNGRSMNDESVRRIEQNFRIDQIMEKIYGPPHVQQIAQVVASMVMAIEDRVGSRVTEEKAAHEALQMSLAGFFGLPFGGVGAAKARKTGEAISRAALQHLGGLDKSAIDEWLAQAKETK